MRPSTSLRDYIAEGGEPPAAALLSDVLHHVPSDQRAELVSDLLEAFGSRAPVVIIKDIVPQGFRSALAFWADRNISGDRGVSAVSPGNVVQLLRSVRADLTVESTPLLDLDYPNYCLVFRG